MAASIPPEMKRDARRAGRLVARRAKRLAPVDTASLQRAIGVRVRNVRRTVRIGSVVGVAETIVVAIGAHRKMKLRRGGKLVTTSAYWDLFTERGTVRTRKQPWLGPAVDQTREQVIRILGRPLEVM
jgi:HK97 gp10 family phage protein